MSDLRIDPHLPLCMLCKDTGLCHHHEFKPGPYRFCGCPAGTARQDAEPGLVARSNAAAAKLGIGAAKWNN